MPVRRLTLLDRLAAIVTAAAVAISGEPALIASIAPVQGHRCSCAAHEAGHECNCALCHRGASAREAAEDAVPPCHRGLAGRSPSGTARGAPADRPCVEGTCGSIPHAPGAPPGIERFLLPAATALRSCWRVERVCGAPQQGSERWSVPETPPPRAA